MAFSISSIFLFIALLSPAALVHGSFAISDLSVKSTSSVGKVLAMKDVVYPNQVSEISIKKSNLLSIKLKVQDTLNIDARPHQVFLVSRLVGKNPQSISNVYKPKSSSKDAYTFELDTNLASVSQPYQQHPGQYTFSLAIGTFPSPSSSSNSSTTSSEPIYYTFATMAVDMPPSRTSKESEDDTFSPLPEIRHVFKKSPKVPSPLFCAVFSGLVLTPWALFIRAYITLRPSFEISVSLHSLLFLASIFAFMGLYCLYWTAFNIFEMLQLWVPLAIVTVFTGHVALKRLANDRVREN